MVITIRPIIAAAHQPKPTSAILQLNTTNKYNTIQYNTNRYNTISTKRAHQPHLQSTDSTFSKRHAGNYNATQKYEIQCNTLIHNAIHSSIQYTTCAQLTQHYQIIHHRVGQSVESALIALAARETYLIVLQQNNVQVC